MSEEIIIRQSLPVRARPDVLYRLALEPRRRVKWDTNFVKAEYAPGSDRLSQNALVNFKFNRRLLGLSFQARYGQLHAPQRGGWESVRHVGPLESFSQAWSFKAVPGGTEVTLTLRARVRYRWIRTQMERILHNMVLSTLVGLQKQVDAPGAQLVEDLGREAAERQKAEREAAKKARKGAKGGKKA